MKKKWNYYVQYRNQADPYKNRRFKKSSFFWFLKSLLELLSFLMCKLPKWKVIILCKKMGKHQREKHTQCCNRFESIDKAYHRNSTVTITIPGNSHPFLYYKNLFTLIYLFFAFLYAQIDSLYWTIILVNFYTSSSNTKFSVLLNLLNKSA